MRVQLNPEFSIVSRHTAFRLFEQTHTQFRNIHTHASQRRALRETESPAALPLSHLLFSACSPSLAPTRQPVFQRECMCGSVGACVWCVFRLCSSDSNSISSPSLPSFFTLTFFTSPPPRRRRRSSFTSSSSVFTSSPLPLSD